jgi:hypothetical protein
VYLSDVPKEYRSRGAGSWAKFVRFDEDLREPVEDFAAEREWTVTHAINHLLRLALERIAEQKQAD